jgi:hypothetical protein
MQQENVHEYCSYCFIAIGSAEPRVVHNGKPYHTHCVRTHEEKMQNLGKTVIFKEVRAREGDGV